MDYAAAVRTQKPSQPFFPAALLPTVPIVRDSESPSEYISSVIPPKNSIQPVSTQGALSSALIKLRVSTSLVASENELHPITGYCFDAPVPNGYPSASLNGDFSMQDESQIILDDENISNGIHDAQVEVNNIEFITLSKINQKNKYVQILAAQVLSQFESSPSSSFPLEVQFKIFKLQFPSNNFNPLRKQPVVPRLIDLPPLDLQPSFHEIFFWLDAILDLLKGKSEVNITCNHIFKFLLTRADNQLCISNVIKHSSQDSTTSQTSSPSLSIMPNGDRSPTQNKFQIWLQLIDLVISIYLQFKLYLDAMRKVVNIIEQKTQDTSSPASVSYCENSVHLDWSNLFRISHVQEQLAQIKDLMLSNPEFATEFAQLTEEQDLNVGPISLQLEEEELDMLNILLEMAPVKRIEEGLKQFRHNMSQLHSSFEEPIYYPDSPIVAVDQSVESAPDASTFKANSMETAGEIAAHYSSSSIDLENKVRGYANGSPPLVEKLSTSADQGQLLSDEAATANAQPSQLAQPKANKITDSGTTNPKSYFSPLQSNELGSNFTTTAVSNESSLKGKGNKVQPSQLQAKKKANVSKKQKEVAPAKPISSNQPKPSSFSKIKKTSNAFNIQKILISFVIGSTLVSALYLALYQ